MAEVWRRGSVITSWLLDLTAEALYDDPDLSRYSGHVRRLRARDGGRSTQRVDEGVPVPVLSAALYQRFVSRGRNDVANKALSAMRAGFGGHTERTESSRRRATLTSSAQARTSAQPRCTPTNLRPTHSCCSAPQAILRSGSCSRPFTPSNVHGTLRVPVIGVARSTWTDEDFRMHARDLNQHPCRMAADATVVDSLGGATRPDSGQLRPTKRPGPACRDAPRPMWFNHSGVLHGDPAGQCSRWSRRSWHPLA